jgi:hypothetical protein
MRMKHLVLAAPILFAVACAAPTPTPQPTTARATPLPSPSATASASDANVGEPSPSVLIAAGLTPRLAPRDVADLVIGRIHDMERQVGRVVTPPRVITIRAIAAADGIEWRVDAEGTFTSARPRGSPSPVAASGYFVILDADGSVIGFGFP